MKKQCHGFWWGLVLVLALVAPVWAGPLDSVMDRMDTFSRPGLEHRARVTTRDPFAGSEHIRDFASTLQITPDGMLIVEERIVFSLPQNTTYHGLFRDLPLTPRWRAPGVSQVPLHIESISLDGRDLNPDDTEIQGGNRLRIFMRDPDQTLDQGEHLFVLRYLMGRQVGFYDKYDELNWNVTGSDWAFPIASTSARIVLPDGASPLQTAGWVGEPGSRDTNVQIQAGQQEVDFRSGKALPPGEELTVAVSWPKGLVTPPNDALPTWTRILPVGIFLVVLLFFGGAWWRYGKDPRPGSIIPRYYPPQEPGNSEKQGMSPAAVSFMLTGTGFDGRGFAAMFAQMAREKVCVISGTPREGFSVKAGTGEPLYAEEAVAFRMLKKWGLLRINKANASVITKLRSRTGEAVEGQYARFWHLSWGISLTGIALAVLLLFGYLWLQFGSPEFWPDALYPELVCGGLLFSLLSWLGCNLSLLWRQRRIFRILGALLGSALLVLFLLLFLEDLLIYLSPLSMVLLGLTCAIPIFFLPHMKAPTREGQRLRDEMAGLEMYIAAAEESRLNMLNPPERTPELYQRLLPYAMVFSLEKAWGAKFADVLEKAGQEPESYTTNLAFAHAFSEAVSRASSSDSKSAFSSGGGGSGSGGGGGGGGAC